ncbi:Trm112 family protein [Nesterenkonia muleiensis]|uniref:Trm112 family protein n=1 Tax=Nesterenkonia muleiensis TaxID=2282648 RepID=UPI00192E4F0F|nr:hypothetical protein [Nesterenkonia muleiensis]
MPATPALDPAVLRILRCPVTGSPLRQDGEELIAINDETRRYPIESGVPRLLKDN